MRALLTLVFLSVSFPSFAGCLDNLDGVLNIFSKVKGIYIRSGNTNDHFVIIDKADCTVSGTDVALGENTKSNYRLLLNKDDKFLQSTLLAAKAQNERVRFRISSAADGYNKIAYIIYPYDAINQ